MKVIPVTVWLTENDVGKSGYFGLFINDKYFVIERENGEIIFTEKVYNWKGHEVGVIILPNKEVGK